MGGGSGRGRRQLSALRISEEGCRILVAAQRHSRSGEGSAPCATGVCAILCRMRGRGRCASCREGRYRCRIARSLAV